ncbi:hypothetical protein ACRAWF_46580 [Streptomyces sp. L7]
MDGPAAKRSLCSLSFQIFFSRSGVNGWRSWLTGSWGSCRTVQPWAGRFDRTRKPGYLVQATLAPTRLYRLSSVRAIIAQSSTTRSRWLSASALWRCARSPRGADEASVRAGLAGTRSFLAQWLRHRVVTLCPGSARPHALPVRISARSPETSTAMARRGGRPGAAAWSSLYRARRRTAPRPRRVLAATGSSRPTRAGAGACGLCLAISLTARTGGHLPRTGSRSRSRHGARLAARAADGSGGRPAAWLRSAAGVL